MAELNTIRHGAGARAVPFDEGLRSHMNKIYGLMSVAMVITGVVAWLFGTDLSRLMNQQPTAIIPEGVLLALFNSPLRYVVMFAPLAFVFGFAAGINRMSESTAQIVFWAFAATMGLSISSIFAVYTGMSIAQVFFVTAIAFAGLSLWGYTTKRDISGWGAFLFMGLIGIIVASIVNIFLGSPAVMFAVSVLGVLIFAGLTAYDTQRLKSEYLQLANSQGQAYLGKAAIMGALSLYLNFLNMFMMLLNLFGQRQ